MLTKPVPHSFLRSFFEQADPNSVDMHKIESPSRFRRMTLPHTLHLAASELTALRQSTPNFRSERSASTSTSGYGTSGGGSDSNQISLVGNMARESFSEPSQSEDSKQSKTDKSVKGKTKDKEKDRLARYLANSKRRASRPFRRAKTLLDNHLG